MNISIKTGMYFSMLIILALALFSACGSPAPVPPIPLVKSAEPSTDQPSASPASNPSVPGLKVAVLYFHLVQRCPSCLCFEERVKYVINKDFKSELASGTLTLSIVNASEPQNASLIKKYRAVATQLFINITKNGTETIKDVQDIWDWGCLKSKDAFDKKVKELIDQSLRGQI